MKIAGANALVHLGYWMLAIVVVGVAWSLRDAGLRNQENARAVDRTLAVLAGIAGFNESVNRAESSHRAFLIHREEHFIAQRDTSLARARSQLDDLRALTADNPAQQDRLRAVDPLLAERAEVMREGERMRRAGSADFLANPPPTIRGPVLSAAIYSLTQAMRSSEIKLLDARREERERGYATALQVLFAVVAGVLLLLVAGYVGLVRAAHAHARVERNRADLANSLPGAVVQYRVFPDGSTLWSAHWADVTERVAMGRALAEAKEAADAANRAKGTFLATLSHEIRTPMNDVLGMLELLSLTRLDGEQRTTLQVARESVRSLLRIIDDILDFSKIEAGKLELRPEPASLATAVERVRNVHSGNASSKGLLLHSAIDKRISPALLFDPVRLQQVLSNLVSNAIEFTEDGSVEISVDLVERRAADELVRITVKDTGADPGRRGTGFGLSISRRLLDLMGGWIEMQSRTGAGTTMVVTLPLPVAAAAGAESPAPGTGPAAEIVADPGKLSQWLPLPPAHDAVNAEVMLELSAGDSAVAREIFKRFCAVTVLDAQSLRKAIGSSTLGDAVQAAHRIKGASRTVGAIGLAQACERVERCAREGDATGVAAGMGAFERELTRLDAYAERL